MFVTRLSMRGLTQICGAFSIHTALLIVILAYLPTGDFTDKELSGSVGQPNDSVLVNLMIATHCSLMLSTLIVSQNLFEGVVQQALCYSSAILYIFMVS